MSGRTHPIEYTCDLCGSGPWPSHEVGEVTVEFRHPQVWEDTTSKYLARVRFDACGNCLATPQAPNPNIQWEHPLVSIDHHNAKPIARKVLEFLFGRQP